MFTRTGPQGIRQVNVRGLVAAAFTHRDSRAGDPDLHTHVAVANKVQTLDGRWLSIDGRVLFKAKVAASETYNTSLEQHLRDALGVRFAARPGADPGKRPIREIVGVDPRLNQRWSTRRAHINLRRGELAIQFQARAWPTTHTGRSAAPGPAGNVGDPRRQTRTPITRRAARDLDERSRSGARWPQRRRLDGRDGTYPAAETPRMADAHWVAQTADRVLAAMEETRSTWQMWHVRAEAQRHVRTVDMPAEQANTLVDLLVDEVLQHRSVALAAPPDGIEEPGALRRVDGSSVYTIAGADLYTSQRILDAEQRLLTVAGIRDGTVVDRSRRRSCPAGNGRERHRPGYGASVPGPADVHLWCPTAAGDRPRRRREDHRHARPHPGLDRRRRPGHRPRPVRCRRCRPRRADRHPHRHFGQTDLVASNTATCRTGRPRSARRR